MVEMATPKYETSPFKFIEYKRIDYSVSHVKGGVNSVQTAKSEAGGDGNAMQCNIM